jgi:DNA-binding MarR family transcriptional regulator
MTNRIDRLEEDGLVERVADPADRRAVRVRLTPAGHTLIDRAVEVHLANEARLVAHLPAGDRRRLGDLLRQLLVRYEPATDAGDASSPASAT